MKLISNEEATLRIGSNKNSRSEFKGVLIELLDDFADHIIQKYNKEHPDNKITDVDNVAVTTEEITEYAQSHPTYKKYYELTNTRSFGRNFMPLIRDPKTAQEIGLIFWKRTGNRNWFRFQPPQHSE